MRRRLLVAGSCILVACSETPTEPDPTTTPPGETVAVVTVSSPVGAVIAVSATVTLTAAASDAVGAPMTVPYTWASADETVVTVTRAGVVTGVGPGATTVTATGGGVSGQLVVTVVAADLARIRSLLEDPLADRLLSGIGGASETALRSIWAACASARSAGNLSDLDACLGDARSELSEGTDTDKGPLLALVAMLVDWIDRNLNL